MGILLGIDGGGSKTTCAIGDETSALATGSAGASNVIRVGEAQAREALTMAVRQACDNARISPREIQRTCIGIAGGARPETAAIVRRLLSELVSGEIEVVGDMVIALEAAFGAEPGVVVIAGTGSIAHGRNSTGQTARAGGWGFAISDEGSGYWIGRAAVAAAMRASDEDSSTSLLEHVMTAWRVNTREQLVLAANSTPSPDFAGLLPSVIAAADSGDQIAGVVLTQAGSELAGFAKIVLDRLFRQESAPVAMSGGVFSNSALVREVFYNALRRQFPAIVVKQEVVDPVHGALQMARRGAAR